MPASSPVLITGATGRIGGRALALLRDAGVPVRAMARKEEKVAAFRADGVEAVLADFDHIDGLLEAMAGVDTVFLMTASNPEEEDQGRRAVTAAMRSGVQRIVHLSTQDANPRSALPWAAALSRTDAAIKDSGLRWTILRPSAFMQNLFVSAPAIRRGFLPQTTGSGAIGWIDQADIAAVAARVLAEECHNGREYFLTGPEALSATDIARRLSSGLGRRVRYLHLPAPVFEGALRIAGVPGWQARGLRHQFVDVVRRGEDNARVMTQEVERITGRPAATLDDFVARHRAELLGAA